MPADSALGMQADAGFAREARLKAEQAGAGKINFPESLTKRSTDPKVA
jgi:hypothetical protein